MKTQKKVMLSVMISILMVFVVSQAFCIDSNVPLVALDTAVKAVDANGAMTWVAPTLAGGTVKMLLTIVNPTSHQAHNSMRFSYYGIDPNTGVGINLGRFDATGNGLDTACFPTPISGQRIGTRLYVEGTVTQYNGVIELVSCPSDSTAFQVVGTGYAVPTTLVSSLAVFTTFDQTARTGGEFYESRLIQLNDVWLTNTTLTISNSTYSNLTITDSTGTNVILRFDQPIGIAFANQYGSMPTVLQGHFNMVGIGSQYATASPRTGVYEVMARGLIADFTPWTDVKQWEIYSE